MSALGRQLRLWERTFYTLNSGPRWAPYGVAARNPRSSNTFMRPTSVQRDIVPNMGPRGEGGAAADDDS